MNISAYCDESLSNQSSNYQRRHNNEQYMADKSSSS